MIREYNLRIFGGALFAGLLRYFEVLTTDGAMFLWLAITVIEVTKQIDSINSELEDMDTTNTEGDTQC